MVQFRLIMVPEAGLEPARYFYRGILSPLRQKLGNKLPAPNSRFLPEITQKIVKNSKKQLKTIKKY